MIKISKPPCPNTTALVNKNYKHPDNKKALEEASYGKCIYCESKVSHVYYGDVEHLKPKGKFPELEFDWDNLGYVCAICNGLKSDKFDEETPLLNPYEDNTNEHVIMLGAFLKHKCGSERGQITISDIGLNRPPLIERRKEKLNKIEKAIEACFRTRNKRLENDALEALKKEAENDKEYSLCIKSLLKCHELV